MSPVPANEATTERPSGETTGLSIGPAGDKARGGALGSMSQRKSRLRVRSSFVTTAIRFPSGNQAAVVRAEAPARGAGRFSVYPYSTAHSLQEVRMPTATVTSKGQVTIPRKVREALRLRPGDRIDFVLGEDGEVRVRAGEVDVSELRGLLRRAGRRPITLEAMEDAIARRGEKP